MQTWVLVILGCLPLIFSCSSGDTDWSPPRPHDPLVVLQRQRDDCGVAAVATLFGLLGSNVEYDELVEGVSIGSRGLSMQDLTTIAGDRGVQMRGYKFASVEAVESIAGEEPWIALLGMGAGGHYVVVRAVLGDTAFALDPSMGSRLIKVSSFEKMWTGYALLVN